MRIRAVLIAAAMVTVLALPAGAAAYVVGGRPWPGHTITYFNAFKRASNAVALATKAWNTSGAHVRFVAVPRSRARVIIRNHAVPNAGAAFAGFCEGYADIGYNGRGVEHVDLNGFCGDPVLWAGIVTHELGHILGLGHPTRGCATMTGAVWMNCKPPPQRWQIRCRFALADDVHGAVRLYGGRVRKKPQFCAAFKAPSAATRFVVSPDGRQVSWRSPSAPKPLFKGVEKPALEALIGATKDTCPTTAASAPIGFSPVPLAAGRMQTTTIDPRELPGPGRWCYSLFVQDQFGRSSGVVTQSITIPNQPPVASFTSTPDIDNSCFQFVDGSRDPDGRITAWHWDYGSGAADGSSDGQNGYYCYESSGTYTVTLTVTDDNGAKGTASQQVTATVNPQPPPG